MNFTFLLTARTVSLESSCGNTDLGHGFVSLREAEEIFRQAASVPTSCYDTDTFEEIFPWHHASVILWWGAPMG